MKVESASMTCLFRHGEDDFSVWYVELATAEILRLKHHAILKSTNLSGLLKQMPITDTLPTNVICLFCEKNGYTLSIREVDEAFIEAYNHQGSSVRGCLADTLAELAERKPTLAQCQNL